MSYEDYTHYTVSRRRRKEEGRKVKNNEENKQRRRMSTNTRRGRRKREDLKTIKKVYRAQESIPIAYVVCSLAGSYVK